MLRTFAGLVALALLLLAPTASSAQVAKELVGRYQMDVPGGDVLELRANGTATLAGDETRWSASGGQLTVGIDVMAYTLQGDRLMLTMGSAQLPWKRIGGTGKAAAPMQSAAAEASAPQPPDRTTPATAAPPAAVGGNPQDAQARQLLTGNAWCSMTYNQVSGTSTTRKVIFRPDGVMLVSGGGETYSSGAGGTYAGQSNTSSAMRWRVENLQLFVDQGAGAGFQDVGVAATRNPNGSVILKSLGREYMMC